MRAKVNVALSILAALVVVAGTVLPQSKVGTSAAPFLGIAIGPRAIGVGGAFVAMASDASALYWNPGGFSQIGHSEFMVAHTQWLLDTRFDWAGVIVNIDGASAVGVSVTQLDYGEEDVTTELQMAGTGETWKASDLAVGLSYCRSLTDRFSIGGTAKLVQQRIWNESASSFALDVGLLYRTNFQGLRIGMSISNFGSDMRLDGKDLYRPIDLDPASQGTNKTLVARLKTDDWPLPLLFRAGVSLEAMKNDDFRLTLAADALRPSDNAEVVNVGGEFSWREAIFVRAGMKSLFLVDNEEGVTVGAGARYELTAASSVGIDYGYEDFGIFGGIQSFSLSVTF